MKTKLTKLAALLLAAVMLAGICACSATEDNPGIGKVGKVSFKLADYMQYYQQYASYANYMSDFNGFIKNQLINYGVQLTHAYDIDLKLDEDEEKELTETVDKQIAEAINGMTIDSSITGEDAIAQAKLEAFKKQLKQSGYKSLESYRDYVMEQTRRGMLIQKLGKQTREEYPDFGPDKIQAYYDENAPKNKESYENDPNAFANAYNSYITGQAAMPLYIPGGMFVVKHCLIQYENQDKVSDTVEGVFGEDETTRIDAIRAALEEGITLEQFITDYVENKDYNDDTVLVPKTDENGQRVEETIDDNPQLGYIQHGYIMNEKMLSKYYEGFGAAACLLFHGKDWTAPAEESDSKADETPAPTATPDPDATPAPEELPPIEKYDIKFYTTTDGHEIAEVKTNTAGGGIHFIYVVDEELPEGQVQFDIADTESEVYQNLSKFSLKQLQDEYYTNQFDSWKANTRIALNDSFIDSYAFNVLRLKRPQ